MNKFSIGSRGFLGVFSGLSSFWAVLPAVRAFKTIAWAFKPSSGPTKRRLGLQIDVQANKTVVRAYKSVVKADKTSPGTAVQACKTVAQAFKTSSRPTKRRLGSQIVVQAHKTVARPTKPSSRPTKRRPGQPAKLASRPTSRPTKTTVQSQAYQT